MLVRAQADSNWRLGASKWARNSTSRGRMPRLIITSMGGFLSRDKIFRAACVACSCLWPSELWIPFWISSMERAGVACLFSPRGERGSSSRGPQFLLLESMSSFLFFLSSTETSFLLLRSSSLSFPLFLKFFNLFSELAEGILLYSKNLSTLVEVNQAIL